VEAKSVPDKRHPFGVTNGVSAFQCVIDRFAKT